MSRRVNFGSVCSGIEAASVAWRQIGWKASWLAEIEPFPSAVLGHHYPGVPNLGDMTKIADKVKASEVAAPDVLVGGTPCQAFSMAGMREGLADPRGELTIRYVELADAIDDVRRERGEQPAIIVWENVPGVLSSKDNAFGCFLGALAGEDSELQPAGKKWGNAGCVYGPKRAIAWRVLDAQYFGLAQRRNRVFLVASARDGFDPAKVLFEFKGVRRDTAPIRTSQKGAATDSQTVFAASSFGAWSEGVGSLRASGGDAGGGSENLAVQHSGFRMVAFGEYAEDETASTMKARDHKDATDLVCSVHGTQDPIIGREIAHALGRNSGQENAVYCGTQNDALRDIGREISPTLRAGSGGGAVNQIVGPVKNLVRRLTPIECERLQGFPDNYTQIPWRDKPAEECPDGHRYKALGNSMAVPCMAWIGKRIQNLIEEQSWHVELIE